MSYEAKKVVNASLRLISHSTPTLFSSELLNGPNKLECCITLAMKDSPETNSLAQWAHSQATRKRKCCERVFGFALLSVLIFFATYEWA
jgi:hypothetical protein